jgi:hypothetical protein
MIIVLILLALVVLWCIGTAYIFNYAFVRRKERPSGDNSAWAEYQPLIDAGIEWIKPRATERIDITSYDGTPLAARFMPVPDAKGTLILFHGFRATMFRDFGCVYEFYSGLGYNLLIPSQRAHGESGGRYLCYGVRERYDCKAWCDYIASRFGDEHDIFLSGLSMGCSTVLMASSLELPASVRGIIADCGFTSPWEEFRFLLQRSVPLPVHPVLDWLDFLTRHIAGFGLKECSTLDCVSKTEIPILFVHGDADTFVPCDFTRQNYAACASEKELVIVHGAGHGVSYLVDTPGCQEKLTNFFKRYSRCEK